MKNPQQILPPKWALHFLRWYCKEDFIDEIEGDLIELFEKDQEETPLRANWSFVRQVLLHFRPAYIRAFDMLHPFNTYGMLYNYWKITWRSLLKQKLYSIINIGGLAVGLTSFILIFLYVQHELSYDTFFPNSDQIYRVYQKQTGNVFMGSDYFAVTPAGLSKELEVQYPEVINATCIREQSVLLSSEDQHFIEKGLKADDNFFHVFPFQLIDGDLETALRQPKSIVITQSLAQKLFGSQRVLGKSVLVADQDNYTVTAVIRNPPSNISFKFSFITSILEDPIYVEDVDLDQWTNNVFQTFFTLTEEASPSHLEDKLSSLLEKYTDLEDPFYVETTYFVQPLKELHLETKANFDIGQKGNPTYVSLFSIVAIFILLLACINYMNLAIARSVRRTKEVGLRKIIGARKWQLIGQFLGESVIISFLALLLAILLTHFLSPVFARLLERPIELNIADNPFLIPGLLIIVLLVGIFSGSYPAFYMSSLLPAQIIKGKVTGNFSGIRIQRLLIIGQYIVSIILIISSIVIYRQFQFIQDTEPGYQRDHIVTIPVHLKDDSTRSHIDLLKEEWLRNPRIMGVTTSLDLPTDISSTTTINRDQKNNSGKETIVYRTQIDDSYIELFDLEIIAGRNFSKEFPTDISEGYIINETAAKALGWTPEEAIGKTFTHWGTETVIGVVKDFHLHSFHMAIQPMMFHLREGFFRYISIKLSPDRLPETLASIEASISKHSPYPFEFTFMDEEFHRLYQEDRRFGELLGFFTMLSIIIASMGLFGLAAFAAQQRTKEIGIRKVLGASVQWIVGMLSQDFLQMVLIGFVIATPIAWYMMNLWLEDFAYRIDIQWWMFAVGGLIAVLIAFFTISSQSIKAAVANPVDSLRNE